MSLSIAYIRSQDSFTVTSLQALRVLIYFDIFSYPLTSKEVFERSNATSLLLLDKELKRLAADGYIYCFDGYYTLQNNIAVVNKRIKGNEKAKQYIGIAKFITKIIRHFPFVRSVMLSGSIAKNYADKNSDIDYFIVTAADRMWVCRLFFVLFHKIVLLNNSKFFCYNYMLDEQHLHIKDHSFYTAIESITLVPLLNKSMYDTFMLQNRWAANFFPNYPYANTQISYKRSLLQKALECFFNNSFGDWLDTWLMKKTEQKWRKNHTNEMFASGKNLELKRYTAKAHTENHYSSIMQIYLKRLEKYENLFNIDFDEAIDKKIIVFK